MELTEPQRQALTELARDIASALDEIARTARERLDQAPPVAPRDVVALPINPMTTRRAPMLNQIGQALREDRQALSRLAREPFVARVVVTEDSPEEQKTVFYISRGPVGNYGARFPSESFFAKGFHFDAEKPSISDFQPLIASTHGRGQRQSELLKLYQEQCLPLAPVATLAGVSVPALITELSRPSAGRPFYVEFHDDGRLASRAAARSELPTILTRSALHTAQTFEILPLLMQKRRCLAPTSLREELEEEFSESEDREKNGWTVVAASERGVTFQELEAGHPALVAERDSIRSLVAWADANVAFVPRPLETFSDPRMKDREARASLGDSSNDALELALFSPGVLYADDLGLRKLGNGLGVSSFSTVSLIQVLAEQGVLGSHGRDELLVSLAERHYFVIEVSPEMLIEALAPGRLPQTARDVFSLLKSASFPRYSPTSRTLCKSPWLSACRARTPVSNDLGTN